MLRCRCRHLVQSGGSKLREFLNFGLKEMMTDELVFQFTWVGGENSLIFSDTRVSNILYQAAQRCSQFNGPGDRAHFQSKMLEVLRTTKQHYRNLKKKVLLKNQRALDGNEKDLLKQIAVLEAQKGSAGEENLSDHDGSFGDDEYDT
ncbi:uncharacterized protein LOC117182581 [Belonocnema kinseyi]|uniref:uncharacterized protein LOC117182581 n=1 Tax=Belonocnema kinseyi TaxID=2817044 RepID=UPI00143D2CB5|nr:uncharacterized protein LOC117182581 [Belonocnema kinseyi]